MNGIGSNSDPGGTSAATATATATLPDPAALRRWVTAFCIIRFDLERGQVVENSYPDPPPLPPDKLRLASFSSFPDSMSHHSPHNRSTLHDSLFSFRLPFSNSDHTSNTKDLDYLYGFVFNRQRQDPRLPRGGEQKSVVILTHLPFSTVFRLLLQILGPLCFDLGHTALSLVASHVAAWPDPVRGAPMELPIGNASLRVHLPPKPELPPPLVQSNPSVPHGLFHDSDLFASFRGVILHLWNLWEMMLIGEPILVIAPTPSQCSEAVSALVSLIAPVPCSVDYRPYFTIHDPEFAHLNSLPTGVSFPPLILGVTNLFFLKSLRNIPTVVSVGSQSPNSTRVLPVNGIKIDQSKFSPSSFFNSIKMKREGPLSLMTEHKEAVWSKYSGCTKPDTAVLNRLVDAGVSSRVEESMSVVNNEILRRHFLELTNNFLAPFGPYFRVNTPIEGISPFMDPPSVNTFSSEEFLQGLAARGPGKFLAKRMRSNWLDLYRRFVGGKNFMPWFQRRRAAAETEQQRLWRQARINVDIQKMISNLSELERLDLFNAVERDLLREMKSYEDGDRESMAACNKLKLDLQAVCNVLPKDTQELLVSNPKRASLLQYSVTNADPIR